MKKFITRIFVVCLLMFTTIGFFACSDKIPEPVVDGYKATYYVDDNFSANGLTLKIYTSKDEYDEISLKNDMILQMPDMTTAGQKTITVVYEEKEYTFKINVVGISSYEITGLNEVYKPGNNFSLANAKLKLYYTNGEVATIDLSNSMLTTAPDMNTAGTQEVKFTYKGKEYSTQINVMLLDHYEITGLKDKYSKDENFDLTNAKLTIYYTNQTQEEVALTEEMLKSQPNMNIQGSKKAEFTHNGFVYKFEFIVGEEDIINTKEKLDEFLSHYLAGASKGDVSVKVDYNLLASFLGESAEKSESVLDLNLTQAQISDKLLTQIYKAVISAIVTEGTSFENIISVEDLTAQLNVVETLTQIVENLKDVQYLDYVIHELILTEDNAYYVNLITGELCNVLNITKPIGVGKVQNFVTKYFNKFDKLEKIDVKEVAEGVYNLFKTYTEYEERYVTLVDDILKNVQTIDVYTVGNIIKSIGKITYVMKYEFQTINDFDAFEAIVDYEVVTDEESLAVRDAFFECIADYYTAQIKLITSLDVKAYLNDTISFMQKFKQTCLDLEANSLGIEFTSELDGYTYTYYDYDTFEYKTITYYYGNDNYSVEGMDEVIAYLTSIKEIMDKGIVVYMKDNRVLELLYNTYLKPSLPTEYQKSININKLAGYAYDLMLGNEIEVKTFIIDVCSMFGMKDVAQVYITRYEETGKLNLIEDVVNYLISNSEGEGLPEEVYNSIIVLVRYIDNTMTGEFDLTNFVNLVHGTLVTVNENLDFGEDPSVLALQVAITLTDTTKTFEENVLLVANTYKEMVVAGVSYLFTDWIGMREWDPDCEEDSAAIEVIIAKHYDNLLIGKFDASALFTELMPYVQKYNPYVYEVIMNSVQVGTTIAQTVKIIETVVASITSGEKFDPTDTIVLVCGLIDVDPTIYLERYAENGTLNIIEDLAGEYLLVQGEEPDPTDLNNAILNIARYLDNTMTGTFEVNALLNLINNLSKEAEAYLTECDVYNPDIDSYGLRLIQAITNTTKSLEENLIGYLSDYDVLIQSLIVNMTLQAIGVEVSEEMYNALNYIVATHYNNALEGTFVAGDLIGDVTNFIEKYLSKDAATIMKSFTSMFIVLHAQITGAEVDYNEVFAFIELPKEISVDYNKLIAKLLDEKSYNVFSCDDVTVQFVEDTDGNIIKEVVTFKVYLDFDMMITSIDADATFTLEIAF